MKKIIPYLSLVNFILILGLLFLSSILLYSEIKNNNSILYKKIKPYFESTSVSSHLNKDIIELLQSGDNTIFIRHADDNTKHRDKSFDLASLNNSFDTIDLKDTAPLSIKGEIQSMIIKKFFEDYNINYNEVWASPILRTKQTAQYFDDIKNIKMPLWLTANELTGSILEEKEKIVELFYSNTNGTNRIIVGHGGFESFFGIDVQLNKSEFLVYNHRIKKPIYHGTTLDLVQFYFK